jgi:hypothetical protein
MLWVIQFEVIALCRNPKCYALSATVSNLERVAPLFRIVIIFGTRHHKTGVNLFSSCIVTSLSLHKWNIGYFQNGNSHYRRSDEFIPQPKKGKGKLLVSKSDYPVFCSWYSISIG